MPSRQPQRFPFELRLFAGTRAVPARRTRSGTVRFPRMLILLSIASFTFGYEDYGIPNLGSPTIVEPMALEIGLQHRFLGKITDDPTHTFFGLSRGAGVDLSLRYVIWSTIDVMTGFDVGHQEFSLATSYSYSVKQVYLRGRLEAQFYNEKSVNGGSSGLSRTSSGFGQAQLQTYPLFKRVVLTGNAGFDLQDQAFGVGTGLEIIVVGPVSIYGDFFPVIEPPLVTLVPHDKFPFQFGVRIATYGHQFLIFAGNATDIGARRLMKGTDGYDLHLGFEIKRLFSFD